MSKPIAIFVGVLLLALLALFSATYTVNFHQLAIKSRFGRAGEGSIITEPGLKFRLPFFADRVKKIDTRLQLIETPLETIPTADGQQVVVKAYLMWKVDTEGEGPLSFYETYRSTEAAEPILSDQFRSALSALGRYRFDDLVGADTLPAAEQAILDQLGSARDDGVLPVTVGISQMLMPPKTTSGVLSRMKATQTRRSEAERFKGNAQATEIESAAGAMAEKILAFADQRAAEIRAAGDEKAAKYLRDMSQDEELAIFLVQIDALEQALAEQTTVILDTAFAPWHLINISARTDDRGLPQPDEQLLPVSAGDQPQAASEPSTPSPAEGG